MKAKGQGRERHVQRSAAAAALIGASMLAACATFGGSAPRRLDTSLDSTGLLVVYAPMRHKGSLSLGIGGSIDMDGAVVVRADTNIGIPQNSMKDLILFQLPPATYRLVAVRGSFRSGNFYHYLVAPVDSVVGPITVTAGQITYVGRLTVTGHSRAFHTDFTYTYEWDRDPAREAETLTIVQKRYKDSPWLPLVRRRLSALPPGT